MTQQVYGMIRVVDQAVLGSALTAAAAIGDTVLTVDDASPFPPDGGYVSVADTVYQYLAADADTDTVTLADPLTVAVIEDDPVTLWDNDNNVAAEQWIAYVGSDADFNDGDMIEATVAHHLIPMLEEGIKGTAGERGLLEVAESGAVRLIDLPDRRPRFDGSVIDPTTLPPATVTTDGTPPAASPAAEVTGGLGMVFVKWAGISNADPVTYDVHVSAASPVAADATTLVASTAATLIATDRLADGAPLAANTTYYAVVVARDADGAAAPGLEGSAATERAIFPITETDISDDAITTPKLAANAVTTDNLAANAVTAAKLDAVLALLGALTVGASGTGRRIVMNPDDGLQVIDQDGTTLVSMPTDAALNLSLNADVIARTLTALGAVALRANNNELAQGAALILRAGTAAPVTAPTAKVTYDTYKGDGYPSWQYGGCWYQGNLYNAWALFYDAGVRVVDADGNRVPSLEWTITPVGIDDYFIPVGGVTHLGLRFYVCGYTERNWRVYVYDHAGTLTDHWDISSSGLPTDPVIGNDGTNIVTARCFASGELAWALWNPGGSGKISETSTGTIIGNGEHLAMVEFGQFDYGADRVVVCTRDRSGGDKVYVHGLNGSRYTGAEWPVAFSDTVAAMVWDGAQFRHLSRATDRSVKYSTIFWNTESAAWKITHTWHDSVNGYETVQGPAASLTMRKRASLQVTTPPLSDLADSARVYVGRGTGDRTTQFLQATVAGTDVTLDAVQFSNTDGLHPNPPVAGDFPTGTPARVHAEQEDSYGPMVDFDGSGYARIAELFSQKAHFQSTQDANTAAGNEPPLRIGNPAGVHLRVDGNEIIAMANDNTKGNLGLNGKFFTAFDYGSWVADTSADGYIRVSHGMGKKATMAIAIMKSFFGRTVTCVWDDANSTTGDNRFRVMDQGSPLASVQVELSWFCIAS